MPYSGEDQRKLGELLEPMQRLPSSGNVIDRRQEPSWEQFPYLGSQSPDYDTWFNHFLHNEVLRRQAPSQLAREAGITDVPEPRPFSLDDMIQYLGLQDMSVKSSR